MSRSRESKLPQAIFKVVARRRKWQQAENTAAHKPPQAATFYWKSFEHTGKIAGITLSLLSACGILFAAGSKVQHWLDDLAALHKKVEAQEERLQQNEANDSEQGEQISYIKGRLDQNARQEEKPSEIRDEPQAREQREKPAPVRRPERRRSSSSVAPLESFAPPLSDKLYAAILYYYRQALRLQPNLAGRLTVRCKADAGGYLAAEVIADTPELAELAGRLAAKIRRWKFPEHVSGVEAGGFQQTYFLSPQGF